MRVLAVYGAFESEANLEETSHDIHVLVLIISLSKRVDPDGFLFEKVLTSS